MDKNFDFDVLNDTPDYSGNPFEEQYRQKLAEYEEELKAAKTKRIASNVATALITGAVVGGLSSIKLNREKRRGRKREEAAWDRGYEYGKNITTYAAENYIAGMENGYRQIASSKA